MNPFLRMQIKTWFYSSSPLLGLNLNVQRRIKLTRRKTKEFIEIDLVIDHVRGATRKRANLTWRTRRTAIISKWKDKDQEYILHQRLSSQTLP